jgi:lipopolysaccharide/colanic/teichoic acid biosynthesis glycosyltransferase
MNPLPYTLELEKPETTTRPTKWANSLGKRAMDFGGALALQTLFAVPMAVVGVCVALDSPGPVVFKQPRIGRDGKPFTLYKFRTMQHEMCELDQTATVQRDDPRVTRIGGFLRRTHLDELPQVWNVLLGDMSIVGPRPHTPSTYELFISSIPDYQNRTTVKPGLTGLPQIKMAKSFTPEDPDNLRVSMWLDNKYIAEASPKRDIQIMLNTANKMAGLERHKSY